MLVPTDDRTAGDKFLYGVVGSYEMKVRGRDGSVTFSYAVHIAGRVFPSYYRGSSLVFLSTKGFTEMRLWANRV